MELETILDLNKKIKENIAVISRFLFYNKKQQYFYANKQMSGFLKNITNLLPELSIHLPEINGEAPVLELEQFVKVLQQLQGAQEAKDYVMQADIMELQILPGFIALEERLAAAACMVIDEEQVRENVFWCQKKNPQLLYSLLSDAVIKEILSDEQISDAGMEQLVQTVNGCVDKGVAVEATSCGYPTMAVKKGENIYYLHTNGNITAESLELAWEWLTQEKEEYTFYGFGLGYPFLEMLRMDHNISIRVFETNREFLLMALLFAPLAALYRTERFEIIYDPTGNKMKHEKLGISEETGFYVFYPALNGIKKAALKEQMELYFMEEGSVRTQFRVLNGNFKRNSRVKASNINDLRTKIQGRDVFLVAAGPSLDQNMEILKNRKEETVLIAVGTVLKKMLNAGIRPDFVIVIDGYAGVHAQIRGAEACGVPMIFLSTVYSKVTEIYEGEKYILCQRGFAPAEALAEENKWDLVESGGSVITTAFDLCLRLKAGRIIFVGLDLAYTGAKTHASETALQRKNVSDTGIYVEAAEGGRIQTAKNLKIYLEWIEKRIRNRTEEERVIPVIDATEGGAKKKGMQIMTLQEAVL